MGYADIGEGKDLVILGVGNLLVFDDGIGIHAVRKMQGMDLDTSRVDIVDGGTSGVEILAHIVPEKLIIIDAVAADAEPGTIFRFKPEEIKDAAAKKLNVSLHDIGLLQSLKIVELMGETLDVVIFGVVPKVYDGWSMELTEEVSAAMPRLIELVIKEAEEILGAPIRR